MGKLNELLVDALGEYMIADISAQDAANKLEKKVLAAVAEMLPKATLTYMHKETNGVKEIDCRYNAGWNDAIAEMRQRLIGGEK